MTAALTISANQTTISERPAFNPQWLESFIDFIGRPGKTTQTYITNLKQFFAYLRFKLIDNPQRKDIINYRDYLASEHRPIKLDPSAAPGWSYQSSRPDTVTLKANTIKAYLQSVCSFFKWTAAEQLYPNIAANIHAPKVNNQTHRKEALTLRQAATVENSIIEAAESRRAEILTGSGKDIIGKLQRNTEQNKRIYAIYMLAVTAGLRCIEISRLKIKDLEAIDGRFYVWIYGKGHGDADTRKAIAADIYAAITDYLSSRTDAYTANSYLFVGSGNRSHGEAIRPDTISKMIKSALKEAGYNSDRITAHSLRHTAGTAVQELTGDIYATQHYMRHANPATTEIYLHNQTDKKEAEIAEQLLTAYRAAI